MKQTFSTVRWPLFAAALGSLVVPALAVPVTAQNARAPQTRRPLQVRFEFEVKLDKDDTPHSRVFVRANGRRTLVLSSTAGFQSLSRAEFASYRVPRTAIVACSGWWAGGGDNLYVVRRGARLYVYHQQTDEQAQPVPYHLLKSIRLLQSR